MCERKVPRSCGKQDFLVRNPREKQIFGCGHIYGGKVIKLNGITSSIVQNASLTILEQTMNHQESKPDYKETLKEIQGKVEYEEMILPPQIHGENAAE